ncbi:MAG: heme-binding protein [Mycobacterium sp.]|nr:heme-binding protein [Mycobacterium sp.]
MNASVSTVRRTLSGMFAGGALAFGSAAIIAPVANAQPAPSLDCSASSVAGTVSTATASEGAYLVAHPETNEALTDISSQAQPEAQDAYRAFFASNPDVEGDLEAIHQPVSALNSACGVEITPTPVAQAVWNDAGGEQTPAAAEAPTN